MTQLADSTSRNRIQSIDILRGIAMVIMALDHVRDFFYKADVSSGGASLATEPTDLATTTPFLFFTRWITHFCAPTFVFLAGTSVFLMSQKKTKAQVSIFLIKRGFWLVFVELIIITFGWTYNPIFSLFILQVIWAIGVSMICLGILIRLPFSVVFIIGLIIVFGHNLLNNPSYGNGVKEFFASIELGVRKGIFGQHITANDCNFLSNLCYFSEFSIYPRDNFAGDHHILIVYAFVPWLGVMMLGYCFGKLYQKTFDPVWRRRLLLAGGVALILLFVVIRLAKDYGDPMQMTSEDPTHPSLHLHGATYSFLSFLNVSKYPPSLAFLSMTIGVAMIALALLEKVQNKVTNFFKTYGRVPMFYYILHFYIIHTVAIVVFFAQRFTTKDIITEGNPFLFKPPGFGFGLWGVYGVWLFVFLVLYPLCKKYDRYKTLHAKEKWWLSYL